MAMRRSIIKCRIRMCTYKVRKNEMFEWYKSLGSSSAFIFYAKKIYGSRQISQELINWLERQKRHKAKLIQTHKATFGILNPSWSLNFDKLFYFSSLLVVFQIWGKRKSPARCLKVDKNGTFRNKRLEGSLHTWLVIRSRRWITFQM